jgi:fimbrial chaperone protein
LAIVLALCTLPAYAMRVSPIIIEMSSTGSGAVARIEVQNLNQAALPFETRVTRIVFDDEGRMTETPADGDFLIFPPQGLVPPGGRQVMRLQFVGDQNLTISQAYYVSVNQLPVTLEPGQNGESSARVQVLYNMKALVAVAPPGATPNVAAVSASAVDYQPPAVEGQALPPKVPGVEIVMRNTGRRYAMMSAVNWILTGRDRQGRPLNKTFTSEELNRLVGTGYVAALAQNRRFRLPVETPFGSGPIQVRFRR